MSFDLFSMLENTACNNEWYNETSIQYKQADIDFLNAYFSEGLNISLLEGCSRILFELSFNAFDVFLHAWLSELPVKRETVVFGRKIIDKTSDACYSDLEKIQIAEKIITDRTDINTLAVLKAATKVQHEIHRMMGFLRFLPDANGEFIAKCQPDHLILPCLAEYFTARFGETAWSIIDEKRGLCLRRLPGSKAKTTILHDAVFTKSGKDEWEELWKHYHKTINNEDRNNPDLQRQFMPKRYWKYLPEIPTSPP
jgi:probable DNA metabolism protein